MKIIYGTNNPSKLLSMKKMLDELPIKIVGLSELGIELSEPEEPFDELILNAEIKAMSYYQQLKRPVFSCDSGLFFDEVTPEDQPGAHIRRIHGQNLKDEEFVHYYSGLASKYGGRLTAQYRNSICLIIDKNRKFEYDGDDLASPKFYIVEKAHKIFTKGYPLDSISVHIDSGKYYFDIQKNKYDNGLQAKGFFEFFRRSLEI